MIQEVSANRFRQCRRRCSGVAVVLTAVTAWPVVGRSEVVLDWNTVMLETVRAAQLDGSASGPGDITRAMAMTQGAVFEAVNSIDRTYFPYQSYIPGGGGASPAAAAAQAAHDVLATLYPSQAPMLHTKLTTTLASVSDGSAKTGGIALGQEAARRMIDLRKDDDVKGALDPKSYQPGSAPGDFVPQSGQEAHAPGWGSIAPFVVPDVTPYRAPPPPALDSPAYAAAFNEVKDLGGLTSTTRTKDQTQAGMFWSYDFKGDGTPPSFFNEIAQVLAMDQTNTLEENARLFALINFAMADAAIAAWDTKYTYDFWRPITAIQRADEDGNSLTDADTTWVPLGAQGPDPDRTDDDSTPPHPSYVSGHSTFAANFFEILALFFCKDDIPFTMTSEEVYCDDVGNCAPITRSFDSFSEAATEAGRSRIYLGIHWNFDDILDLPIAQLVADADDIGGKPYGGQPVGELIARFVFNNCLEAVPAPPAAALLAASLVALGWQGRGAGNRRRR
jgi:hypothetical protein